MVQTVVTVVTCVMLRYSVTGHYSIVTLRYEGSSSDDKYEVGLHAADLHEAEDPSLSLKDDKMAIW